MSYGRRGGVAFDYFPFLLRRNSRELSWNYWAGPRHLTYDTGTASIGGRATYDVLLCTATDIRAATFASGMPLRNMRPDRQSASSDI